MTNIISFQKCRYDALMARIDYLHDYKCKKDIHKIRLAIAKLAVYGKEFNNAQYIINTVTKEMTVNQKNWLTFIKKDLDNDF